MRVKFVESEDLEVLESTANMLLMEGWERDSTVQFLPNGKYFMSFVKYTSHTRDRIPCGESTVRVGQNDCPPPQPTICTPDVGRD